MIRLIPLAFLLAILGAPSFPGARDVQVSFQQDGPEGIYGVACSRELFGDVTDNAQALCGDLPDGTALIYADAIGNDRALLLNILRHESEHLRIGAVEGDSAWERFQERRAYAAGCRYSWVPMCEGWLR